MNRFLSAAAAALLAFPPAADAETMTARRFHAREIPIAALAPGSVVLSVLSRGRGTLRLPEAASGPVRPVVVDGVLMEMDEGTLGHLIRAGVFVVVHPGTNIPWQGGGAPSPSYPPDWANTLF